MRINICFYLMQTHVLFILSLVLLRFNTMTTTSLGPKLVVAAGRATNTCIDNERQALLAFKARLLDPEDLLSSWRPGEEDDCCKWNEVTCNNQTGHVTKLELCYDDTSGVGGEISLSLLNLTYLNHLDLSYCSFYGMIPSFIGSMTHLTYLDLSNNEFIGTIPMFTGNMTQLKFLSLSHNQFAGTFPNSIISLTGLTVLSLDGNQFVGTIPMSIGYLNILTDLSLGENNFSGIIPRSIGSLRKLKTLYLSENSFHGTIPPEFGNLTNLESFLLSDLKSCRVENLDWLSSLSSLSELNMEGTSLAKADNWVNVVIGLQNLEWLKLSRCDLSKVMHPYSSVVNSSSSADILYLDNNDLNSSCYRWLCPLIGNRVKELFIYGNSFDGKLADFLNNLSRCTSPNMLNTLDASSNRLTGSLSDDIQNFSSLNVLYLDYNKLNGTISDQLWQLPTLQELHLSSNSLRGVISENIEKSNLLFVDLSWNSLEGVFFNDVVSNLSMSIKHIDFSSNNLGPSFPKFIQKMKKLTYLYLSNNSISDTIPNEFWNQWRASQLRHLDLSYNNISGSLPQSLSSPNLEKVDLSSNRFYGPIPSFLARISFLDLSRNSLTGLLPDSLKNLTHLKVLNLGHNTLSGYIPPFVGRLGQLETLSLHNNSLYGELPLSLKNCTMLSLLDLGANNLIGNIPVWIGKNLSKLYALSLKSNNFSGAIPPEICQLISLQILDLSYNNLHGTIPSCVHNLTSMVKHGLFTEHNLHHYSSSVNLASGSFIDDDSYIDHMLIEWQGRVNEFSSTLGLVKTIDLSNNNLKGKIPNELTNLHGLLVLDLSHNALVGEIPRGIGKMTELLTLNLSRNFFSGQMPSTMSQMDRLNDLDVSYNNLRGRVPSSTQLQSFPPERFSGNVGLCGLPTMKKCLEDEDHDVPHIDDSEDDAKSRDEVQKWFYIGGATGFATAFWVSCSALVFNRRLRHVFFQFYDFLKDWVYVQVVVFIARLQMGAHA